MLSAWHVFFHTVLLQVELGGLGVTDHETVDASILKKLRQPRGSYQAYSDKDRSLIGKDASTYGDFSATRKWKKTYPNVNESTVPLDLESVARLISKMRIAKRNLPRKSS